MSRKSMLVCDRCEMTTLAVDRLVLRGVVSGMNQTQDLCGTHRDEALAGWASRDGAGPVRRGPGRPPRSGAKHAKPTKRSRVVTPAAKACPDCGKRIKRNGMGTHRRIAHGRDSRAIRAEKTSRTGKAKIRTNARKTSTRKTSARKRKGTKTR